MFAHSDVGIRPALRVRPQAPCKRATAEGVAGRPGRVAKRHQRFAKSPRVRIQMAFIIHKSPHLWWELLCMEKVGHFDTILHVGCTGRKVGCTCLGWGSFLASGVKVM